MMEKQFKSVSQQPPAKHTGKRTQQAKPAVISGAPEQCVFKLQKTIGNRSVRRLMKTGKIQAKPVLGTPGDRHEQEADRIAGHIVNDRRSNQPGQSDVSSHSLLSVPAYTLNRDDRRSLFLPVSGGSELSPYIRKNIEPVLGVNLNPVRVHNEAADRQTAGRLKAKAFTYHNHIWLGCGQTQHNLHLMAHEAVHVVQQSHAGDQGMMIQRDSTDTQPNSGSTGDAARSPVSSGPPVLFGYDTQANSVYLSVAFPGRNITEVATYLYGSPVAVARLRETNGQLPEQLRPGYILRLTGDNLTETAHNALNESLQNGTVLRTAGVPAQGAEENHMYRFTAAGRDFVLTEIQLQGMYQGLKSYLIRKANYIKGISEGHQETHADHISETNSVVRGISNMLGGTSDPPVSMWNSAINTADRVRTYLEERELSGERITAAAQMLQIAAQAYANSKIIWSTYINATIAGAGAAVSALEFTRDVSFGIAIGIGAVVAFPVVASAAATTLGTGTVASGVIAGTTVVGAGATVRGTVQAGSNIVGQALTGEKIDWDQVKEEYRSGYQAGAVDAAAGLIGYGTARSILRPMARYTGEFATSGQRLVTQALAYGAGGTTAGAFAGGTTALLEGKSGEEILQSTLYGGLMGGAFGVGGALLGPVVSRVFPYQYGPGARSFRLTPNQPGYRGATPPAPRIPAAPVGARPPGGGLETRGYRPPPGSRSMTREQWRAQYRTQRLLAGEQPVRAGFGRRQRIELIQYWRDQIRGLPGRTDLSPAERNMWRRRYFANIRNLTDGRQPHWRQSEAEMQYYYSQIGGTPEVPYIHGRRATRFTPGHTRPDISHSRVLVECKRYTLFDSRGRLNVNALENRLIPTLRQQIGDRAIHAPANIRQQSIILDLRGQHFQWTEATEAARRIAAELSGELTRLLGQPAQFPVSNIQIVHN